MSDSPIRKTYCCIESAIIESDWNMFIVYLKGEIVQASLMIKIYSY